MEIEARIAYDTPLLDLLPQGMFRQDVDVEGPPGTKVHYEGMVEYRAVDVPPALQFILDVGSGATATLIATWVITRFRGKTKKLTINRREVDLDDEGNIRRVIEEIVDYEQHGD